MFQTSLRNARGSGSVSIRLANASTTSLALLPCGGGFDGRLRPGLGRFRLGLDLVEGRQACQHLGRNVEVLLLLGLEAGRSFSQKVLYIYDRQLAEADLIVVATCTTGRCSTWRAARESIPVSSSGPARRR